MTTKTETTMDTTSKSEPHRYRLAYKLEDKNPGLLAEEAKAMVKDGWGACDAMLIASIIYPADGSLSIMFVSKDGRTGEDMTDHEWFKVWSLLTSRLSKSTTLADGKRGLCEAVFGIIRKAITVES